MPTKIIYIGTKPASSTGADVESNGPLSPANVDQIHANLQAAVDAALPSASAVVGGGAGTVPKLDTSGNLRVGASGGSWHAIYKSATADAGNIVFSTGNGVGESAYFYAVNGGTVGSAANAAMKANKDSVTSRSMNAGGTINAAGADYAEYIRKCLLCALILKGQIVGFNLDGELTDRWADAISYGVKSTNPNLVGGDTWGNEDVIGKRPTEPAKGVSQPGLDAYAVDLAAFEERLEAERLKYDRIAFSGLAPCNVSGAAPGDYIIAIQDGEGIAGMAVTSPTFEQYLKAVGRVKQILDDGRPEIAVIVH